MTQQEKKIANIAECIAEQVRGWKFMNWTSEEMIWETIRDYADIWTKGTVNCTDLDKVTDIALARAKALNSAFPNDA